MESEITWGDSVQVSNTAPSKFRPSEIGSVCGFRTLDSCVAPGDIAQGTEVRVCLVEFANGDSIEIPESLLKKLPYD